MLTKTAANIQQVSPSLNIRNIQSKDDSSGMIALLWQTQIQVNQLKVFEWTLAARWPMPCIKTRCGGHYLRGVI